METPVTDPDSYSGAGYSGPGSSGTGFSGAGSSGTGYSGAGYPDPLYADTGGDAQDVVREHGTAVAADARARTGEVAGHAASAARDVKDAATEHVRDVTDEALSQARDLVAQARARLGDEADARTTALGSSLRDLATELARMAEYGEGGRPATALVREAADRAHQVADLLDGRSFGDVVADLQRFARRRPGAYLVGAAALGLLAGRLGRGVKDAGDRGPSGRHVDPYPATEYRAAYRTAPPTPPLSAPGSTLGAREPLGAGQTTPAPVTGGPAYDAVGPGNPAVGAGSPGVGGIGDIEEGGDRDRL